MRLQTKVLAVLAPLALMSSGFVLLMSRRAVNTVLLQGVAERGLLALTDAMPHINAGVRAGDEKTLLPLLNDALQRLHAPYALALDARGKVLAHTNVMEKGKKYGDPVTVSALNRQKPGFEAITYRGAQIIDLAVPIWAGEEDFLLSHESGGKKRIGTLRLGLPLDQAEAAQTQILTRVTAILLISGGVLLAVIMLFLRRILLPVGRLAAAAGRIGRGQYGVTIPVTSKDELGDLSYSFNQMSQDLKTTTVSKDYLDGVIRSIVDILIVTDPLGNIRSINPAVSETLGYQDQELLRRHISLLFDAQKPPSDAPAPPAAQLETLFQTGVVKDVELRFSTKTGRSLLVLFSGSELKNGDGQREGFVIVAKDLTERKKLEALLGQTEKLKAVGQLAAGVAHEINNPLGVILGFSQSMAKKLDAHSDLALPIKSIEREALRCKNLVQDLLTFSRQSQMRMEDFDLNAVIDTTLSFIEAQARMKGIDVVKEAQPVDALVGDKNQLQQILVNLCNNAMDAMPDGGKIVVRTRMIEQGGTRWAQLEVQDNGPGIPKEIREKVFDPFFTTKEVGKGTGLGLSLVYEHVHRHKGTIALNSEVGRGTTFIVSLPVPVKPKRPAK